MLMHLVWRPHAENHGVVHEETKAQRDAISGLNFTDRRRDRKGKDQKREKSKTGKFEFLKHLLLPRCDKTRTVND